MRRTSIHLAICIALGTPVPALAESVEDRLARLEALVVQLQERLVEQEATITEQKTLLEGTPERVKEIADELAQERGAAPAEAWYRNIDVAGLVEIEASHASDFADEDASDIALATFELGVASRVTDWVEVGAALLFEEDDTPLEIDVAFATIGNPERSPWFFTGGQIYVPFGIYESHMVSDPLTLELGETRETALQAGFLQDAFSGSVYVFNGEIDEDGDDEVASWGAELGFGQALAGGEVAAGIGYVSNLGDSDSFQEITPGDGDHVGAWTLHALGSFGPVTLVAEYLAAADDFEAPGVAGLDGAEPSAWNLEAGYGFDLGALPASVAVGYQGTDEAVALELPERRILAALSLGLYENTALTFEWAHDEDYDLGDGGTGEDGNTLTAQLAVEF